MTVAPRVRVAVLRGGPSSEHEVSLKSGQNVLAAIDQERFDAIDVMITKGEMWEFSDGQLLPTGQALEHLKQIADIAFIALHGAWGEDGTIQTLLERINLPYTGSGPEASARAMDKGRSNDVFTNADFRVPNYLVVTHDSWATFQDDLAHKIETNIEYPLVVKPANGGSSVGVSIVEAEASLHAAMVLAFMSSDLVMLQRFISGREITCAILEDLSGNARALPPTEITPKVSSFFDYRAKYEIGGSEEITPAPLTDGETKAVQQLSQRAHQVLGCRGISRSDFILDQEGRWWILETNTIPGLTSTSLLPQAAAAKGITFTALITQILDRAMIGV